MNSIKRQMIKIIIDQPDESSFDDILKRLIFIGNIYKEFMILYNEDKNNNKTDF